MEAVTNCALPIAQMVFVPITRAPKFPFHFEIHVIAKKKKTHPHVFYVVGKELLTARHNSVSSTSSMTESEVFVL